MSASNPFNVYRGPDSLRDYYDPDQQPMIPLVEIPRKLNPFYEDGVRIYAKMMSTLPANNVKALPALNMLQKEVTSETKTIIEYSSGSTVISMSIIARVLFGIEDTRAFLSNKTSMTKLQLMRFFGLNITLFGGPSQPEPNDERGGIRQAEKLGKNSREIINPNQYLNDLNWGAHVRWTGPQIMKQLPEINVMVAGMGTSGTMTGIGTCLKQMKPFIVRVGVCTKAGDRVPGPRSFALMSPVEFPWREAVDIMEEAGSYDSYRLSLELSREGLICGPSSGFNLQGLYNFLQKHKDQDTLSSLAKDDGNIHCVFICCDLPYQYLDDYFVKLGETPFHPLQNRNLLDVDLHRYDEAWEWDAEKALSTLYGLSASEMASVTTSIHKDACISVSSSPILSSGYVLLDFRSSVDFDAYHLPGAVNRPLLSCSSSTPSPFFDPQLLESQWLELESVFDTSTAELLSNQSVFLVCYDGDTSRIATSVLRAKGINACSIRSGIRDLNLGSALRQSVDHKVISVAGNIVHQAPGMPVAV